MKSVLISIAPRWCELIANGQKTIEVRKTKPKTDTPFKCYIYCTYGNVLADLSNCQSKSIEEDVKKGIIRRYVLQEHKVREPVYSSCAYGNGKVIGEFVCNKVEEINCCVVPYLQTNNLGYEHFLDNGVYKFEGTDKYNKDGAVVFERQNSHIDTMLKNNDFKKMCLTPKEVFNYIKGFGNKLYNWHISDLMIYDKPKELGEFKKAGYMSEEDWLFALYPNTHCHHSAWAKKFEITGPPQSWYYVNELN